MGKKENEATDGILNAIAPLGVKLTRMQCGQWKTDKGHYIRGGDDGWSDYVGWRSVVVTPEMVGRRVAIFTAIEMKTKKGRAGEQQEIFRRIVEADGGLACIAHCPEDALAMLDTSTAPR